MGLGAYRACLGVNTLYICVICNKMHHNLSLRAPCSCCAYTFYTFAAPAPAKHKADCCVSKRWLFGFFFNERPANVLFRFRVTKRRFLKLIVVNRSNSSLRMSKLPSNKGTVCLEYFFYFKFLCFSFRLCFCCTNTLRHLLTCDVLSVFGIQVCKQRIEWISANTKRLCRS